MTRKRVEKLLLKQRSSNEILCIDPRVVLGFVFNQRGITMKLFILSLVFVSTQAFAHIEPGSHVGATAKGASCSMEADVTYFENSMKHPLNERIKIKVGSDEFLVGHPPVIDAAQELAHFNHDVFHGVLPTSTGAKALVIEMVHTQSAEGPIAFTVVENNWKTGAKSSIRCEGLKFVK